MGKNLYIFLYEQGEYNLKSVASLKSCMSSGGCAPVYEPAVEAKK